MKVQVINMQSPYYQQERELRNLILLRPIGIEDYGWEHFDSDSYHFVALEDERVIGCSMLYRETDKKLKLMQMAVHTDFQSQGVGRELVNAMITLAYEKGAQEIYCHSRFDAIAFYKKFDFTARGEEFLEVNVLHQQLTLDLTE